MTKKIAIQGVPGAFHEIAAKQYFVNEEIDVLPCHTFEDLFDSVEQSKADFGIVAIENSVAGGLLPNYSLLRDSKFDIIGEVYLRVEQNLMVLPNQKIEDIKEVHSHHMAISQCRPFFKKYPHVNLIESEDTALSAQYIRDKQITNRGAIASKLAAEMYGLEIIEGSIETNKKNFTRFLIVQKEKAEKDESSLSKSSICFSLPHEEGSLSQVLSVFSFYKINLSKIQSLPIVGELWEYLFYVDLVFDDYERYKQALNAIKPLTKELEILGEYIKGDRPHENRNSK